MMPILYQYVRTGKICLFLLPSLTSTQLTGHIPQETTEHAESTTLQRCRSEASAGNTVRVLQAHLRCTAVATVLVVFIGARGR